MSLLLERIFGAAAVADEFDFDRFELEFLPLPRALDHSALNGHSGARNQLIYDGIC